VRDLNRARDKKTGDPKGFAFLGYQDPRSCILAVDNLNGIQVRFLPPAVRRVRVRVRERWCCVCAVVSAVTDRES
jgi:RNA-binding motif X-linked protein 2